MAIITGHEVRRWAVIVVGVTGVVILSVLSGVFSSLAPRSSSPARSALGRG